MSDEERALRKYSRRSAIGLMGIGAVGVASETLGFTQLSADRGVNVAVADDADGVLGVRADETKDGDNREDIDGTFDDPPIDLVFINQSNQTISRGDLTVEISTEDNVDVTISDADNRDNGDFDNTDVTISGSSAQFTTQADLEEGEEGVLEVDVDSGVATITVTVVEAVFNGTNLSLSRTATLDDTT